MTADPPAPGIPEESNAQDLTREPGGHRLDPTDETYVTAVNELLGALAYGELRAFSQLAADSEMAPTLRDRSALARLAAMEVRHFGVLSERLESRGVPPEDAMEPFVAAIEGFHERTNPTNWLEGLVKAYVGEGIARDFYREIAEYVDEDTKALVTEVLADTGAEAFIVGAVRQAIKADPKVAGPLALWGRRLVGEALTQAQRVGVERDALASLLVGAPGRAGADLAELGRMFARLTDAHTQRMTDLGLSA